MLHDSLKPVQEKKEALKKVLSDNIAEREGEIRERGDVVLGEINGMVEEINWYSSSVREETD